MGSDDGEHDRARAGDRASRAAARARLDAFTCSQSIAPAEPAGAIADVALVRAHLVAAARRRQPLSYSGLIDALGHRFTRPKMRALCRTLDAIDAAGAAAGEPELAVLVVRESDALPGQGWWAGGRPLREGYEGPWTGAAAVAFVRRLQERAYDHWGSHSPKDAP